MRMYDIICHKRNGKELTDEEITFFVKGYTDSSIPDYQASALCMAVFFNGMSERETITLTEQMTYSGDTVDLSRFGDLSVDKHSTGGVGDKTSLIVAPIVASLGGKVSKMSGRGLGHTGGTVDKLEAIPGYRTSLTGEEFLSQVEKVGMAVIGQTGNLAPADKKLYALRDVTATVDSIPLITSSIMSKKLASGSHSIVLDVKVGCGAFMKDPQEAELLATQMVKIGKGCGRCMAALITNMDTPLGMAVGNSLEVIEAVNVLRGKEHGALRDVCVALATEMTALCKDISTDEAKALVLDSLDSGRAYEKMKEWISYQGGDVSYIENTDLFSKSEFSHPVTAKSDGYLYRINALEIGNAACILGAGRASKDDLIDHSAGIILNRQIGDYVRCGETICTLYTNDPSKLSESEKRCISAVTLSSERPPKEPLIYKIIH